MLVVSDVVRKKMSWMIVVDVEVFFVCRNRHSKAKARASVLRERSSEVSEGAISHGVVSKHNSLIMKSTAARLAAQMCSGRMQSPGNV